MNIKTSIRLVFCLLALAAMTSITMGRNSSSVTPPAAEAKDTTFTGTVWAVPDSNNQVSLFELRSTNERRLVRMTEGGDKIKALVGLPAGGVTIEVTGTTYHPADSASLFMIVKSVKKL